MLPVPTNMPTRFEAFGRLLDGMMVPPRVLAQRWALSDQTLSNLRSQGRGIPYFRGPGGSIRYRLAEIIAAELAGTCGPLTAERVALELEAMREVPDALKTAIVERLRRVERGGD